MKTTPILGVSYPEPTDHTRLWEYFEALALADDAQEKRPCWKGAMTAQVNIPTGEWYVPAWVDQHSVGVTRVDRTVQVSKAGVYRVTAMFDWATNSAGYRRIQILANPANNGSGANGVGGSVLANVVGQPVTTSGWNTVITATTVVKLNAADRLTTQCQHNAGAFIYVGANGVIGTQFTVEYLGVDDD